MSTPASTLKTLRLALAIATALAACPVVAQEVDHSSMDHSTMEHPAPPEAKGDDQDPVPHAAHATHAQSEAAPAAAQSEPEAEVVDHSTMDHSSMDHSSMEEDGVGEEALKRDDPVPESDARDDSTVDGSTEEHSGMDHSTMDDSSHAAGHDAPGPAAQLPREPIPALTDADRRAAFPELAQHPAHGDSIHSYFLANRLEAWDAEHGTGMAWEAQAWIGKDLERIWIRSEGERAGGETEAADVELLYGRSVSPWWDVVAGVRHDFKPGDAQSHLAIGVMGLAPQWFEIEATAYLSEHGRVSARIEAEYELLITNRLILQPLIEASLQGGSDPARGIGSGLGTVEAGLRLRYEFTRQFAPYIGLVHERAFGGTADYRRDSGEPADDTRVVAGLRIWF